MLSLTEWPLTEELPGLRFGCWKCHGKTVVSARVYLTILKCSAPKAGLLGPELYGLVMGWPFRS